MKKILSFILAVIIIPSVLTSCGSNLDAKANGDTDKVESSFFAMDTSMEFSIYGDEKLLDEGEKILKDLADQVSVTDENSEIYKINKEGKGKITGKGAELMEKSLELCKATDGALDISIYPIVRQWGFTTDNYKVPTDESIKKILQSVSYKKIKYNKKSKTVTLDKNMEIDLGSVAKGYGGKLVADYFREKGVTSGILNLGGNVQTIGAKPDGSPWKVAIKDPQDQSNMAVLSVKDKCVITSGGYERYFEEDGKTYWHIMDPATGKPANSGLLSVTIVGDDGLVCDGLSTSLFIMGLDKAVEFWKQNGNFEAVFVDTKGEIYITEGLKETFALTQSHSHKKVSVIS